MALLTLGRLEEGWPAYEARLPRASDTGPPRLETLKQARGARVLLRAEQGFGDMLQFCLYLPMLAERGARVTFMAPEPLVRPLRGSLGVDRVITADAEPPASDFGCWLMSLPALFNTSLACVPAVIPYLRPDPVLVAPWRGWWSGERGMRVGVALAGGARVDNAHALAIDLRRSVPLALLAPLLAVENAVFVALSPGRNSGGMRDPTAGIGDFADTVALLETLDLVISVDTAVAHLAGALGRPVWLLNRFDTCWRWLDRGYDSPCYPTLRQFRQGRPGDWDSVIARVAAALRQRLSAAA